MAKPAKEGILDKNGRLFGRISVIDIAVVILAAGLVFGVVYRFTSGAMAKDVNCRVRYTLLIEGVREFTLDYYQTGLSCFDKTKQEYIGDIAGVRSEPLTGYEAQSDGSLLPAVKPNSFIVYVDIESDARETSSALLLNGAYELKVGSKINLNTKYIDVSGVIVSYELIN